MSRVLHVVRNISSTSFPWNEIYGNQRVLRPGSAHVPVAVGPHWRPLRLHWAMCGGQRRRYLRASPIGLVILAVRLRRGGQSIVHLHNPSLVWGVLLMMLFLRPLGIVFTQHNNWADFGFFQRMSLRMLVLVADRYTLCGGSLVSGLPSGVKTLLERRGRLQCIPNGINLAILRPFLKVDHVRKDGLTAVVVARMVPQKNCRFVLDLVEKCQLIARLTWFGEGPEREEIEREIAKRGLGNRIVLMGKRPRSEVLQALSTSALYLNASRWEGLSVADLEALALGPFPLMARIDQRLEFEELIGIRLLPLNDPEPWVEAVRAFDALPADAAVVQRRERFERTISHFDLLASVRKYLACYDGFGQAAES